MCFFIRKHNGLIYFESRKYSKLLLLTTQNFLDLCIASWPASSGGGIVRNKRVKVPTAFTQPCIVGSWHELGCVAIWFVKYCKITFVQLLLLTVVNYCMRYQSWCCWTRGLRGVLYYQLHISFQNYSSSYNIPKHSTVNREIGNCPARGRSDTYGWITMWSNSKKNGLAGVRVFIY